MLIDQTQKQRRRHLRDSLHLVNDMKVTFDTFFMFMQNALHTCTL